MNGGVACAYLVLSWCCAAIVFDSRTSALASEAPREPQSGTGHTPFRLIRARAFYIAVGVTQEKRGEFSEKTRVDRLRSYRHMMPSPTVPLTLSYNTRARAFDSAVGLPGWGRF